MNQFIINAWQDADRQKVRVSVVAVLALCATLYGYYDLWHIVPVFAEIFTVFETPLSLGTVFLLQFHRFFICFAFIGLLPLWPGITQWLSLKQQYALIVSTILLMFSVRWLTAHMLQQSVLTLGLIQ